MSKGEDKIRSILQMNRVPFECEKTFNDLHCGKLRFDFYLPKNNTIIEFDGEQHFHQIQYFQKDRKDLLSYQERDRQKNSYCLAHSIKLFRIPYWELDNVKTLKDLTQTKFLVRDRWHNDKIWRKHKK